MAGEEGKEEEEEEEEEEEAIVSNEVFKKRMALRAEKPFSFSFFFRPDTMVEVVNETGKRMLFLQTDQWTHSKTSFAAYVPSSSLKTTRGTTKTASGRMSLIFTIA